MANTATRVKGYKEKIKKLKKGTETTKQTKKKFQESSFGGSLISGGLALLAGGGRAAGAATQEFDKLYEKDYQALEQDYQTELQELGKYEDRIIQEEQFQQNINLQYSKLAQDKRLAFQDRTLKAATFIAGAEGIDLTEAETKQLNSKIALRKVIGMKKPADQIAAIDKIEAQIGISEESTAMRASIIKQQKTGKARTESMKKYWWKTLTRAPVGELAKLGKKASTKKKILAKQKVTTKEELRQRVDKLKRQRVTDKPY